MKHAPHILLVDDDPKIRSGLVSFLSDQHFDVSVAEDGSAMKKIVANAQIDLIILDIMLPDEDGLSLCRHLAAKTDIPIIFLTAMAGVTDRIVGLELGAEDYVCKPFDPRELLARIRIVLRRGEGRKAHTGDHEKLVDCYEFDGWNFDIRARTLVSPGGSLVDLTTGEFDLLQAFVDHPNVVLNRDQLLDLAHGRTSLNVDRAIDVQVMRLRRKIEMDPQSPNLIKTIRNGGYIFTPKVRREHSTEA